MTWVTVFSLSVVIALVVVRPELRALAQSTGREMIHIPPAYLALIVAIKVTQAFFSALIWRNALLSAWPDADLSYRFVLGVDQGQDALNTVAPARAGTWAMLGILGLSIPGASAPKLVAVWGMQSIAFSIFAVVNYLILGIGLPQHNQEGGGKVARVTGFMSSQPWMAAAIGAGALALLIIGATIGRRRVLQIRQQMLDGLAILGTPSRYIRLIFLPSLASYLLRTASNIVMMAAFGIPITLWTLSLVLGSRALAGAVRVTPGGLGTTQAMDVVVLGDYASADVITAYSLSDFAISAILSFAVAIPALLSVNGWNGTKSLLRYRDQLSEGVHTLAEHERTLLAPQPKPREVIVGD
jgi:hypothetical protein